MSPAVDRQFTMAGRATNCFHHHFVFEAGDECMLVARHVEYTAQFRRSLQIILRDTYDTIEMTHLLAHLVRGRQHRRIIQVAWCQASSSWPRPVG
jgi:hypothetical protein